MAKDDEKTLRLVDTKPEPKPKVDDGLIEVSKNGEVLRVHPTALHEHRKLGWE